MLTLCHVRSKSGSQLFIQWNPDSHLIEEFLVKLELERLSNAKGQSPSNAEKALQIENKILKQRLRTLKDNINILNSMIEHIRIDPASRKENQVRLC